MRYINIIIFAVVFVLALVLIHSEEATAGIPMPCNVVIEKVEVPGTAQLFQFDVTGDVISGFVLSNGNSNPVGLGIDQTIEIREDVPDNTTLEIECTQGVTNCGQGEFVPCLSITLLPDGTGVSATCLDDDDGSCTFTNILDTPSVPTLSEWGLIAMAGVLGLIAFFVLRRKKAVA